MERAAWTEERLDDLADAMRSGFERMDRDIRDLRTEMDAGFDRVDRNFQQLRSEINARFTAFDTNLRGEIDALRQTMLRVAGGMIVGFLSVIAAVLTAS